jgi:hypothetical protein
MIRTIRGDVAVEDLVVGDMVVTNCNEHRSIKWLGHRQYRCATYGDEQSLWPIRIAENAFGFGKPDRDLYVSQGHSIAVTCVGEVLVHANSLVNGATVARVPVDKVTYWHVELDSHDIILANGLPAETYLEMGNREAFCEGTNITIALGPDGEMKSADDFCRPFIADGPVLAAIRCQLEKQAVEIGWSATHDMGIHLVVDGKRVDGDAEAGAIRFFLPSTSSDVFLVSEIFRPGEWGSSDQRELGIAIHNIGVYDGLHYEKTFPIGDSRFASECHPEEAAAGCPWRWTNGKMRIPKELWAGCKSYLFLRVDYAEHESRRWQAPRPLVSSAPLLVAVN